MTFPTGNGFSQKLGAGNAGNHHGMVDNSPGKGRFPIPGFFAGWDSRGKGCLELSSGVAPRNDSRGKGCLELSSEVAPGNDSQKNHVWNLVPGMGLGN